MYMNKQECDILNVLKQHSYTNQRDLSQISGYSLGAINQTIAALVKKGYLDANYKLTEKAQNSFAKNKPQNAVILAAGFGMRMVPINTLYSKGLLKINNETLIERTIKQLNERGINEIYIVVGFMKEQYEYLIDKYNVKLVVNPDYQTKNNIYSLKKVLNKIGNSYIIPCDIWCRENPFHKEELYSWYMMSKEQSDNTGARVNRKYEIIKIAQNSTGNRMIGISYITNETSSILKGKINQLCNDSSYNDYFWEEGLFDSDKMYVWANMVSKDMCIEINTYEQLRDIDEHSEHLQSDAIDIICESLQVPATEVVNITVLKKGMTNRSFLFNIHGEKYIMRIPGEGTENLINRKEEAEVYQVISGKGICDDVIYMNPHNGYKITKFLTNSRVCNPHDQNDLQKCMAKLRSFHKMNLKVQHEFNIWKQIDFYESLWNGQSSIYNDYGITKDRVLTLRKYIESHVENKCLTHIDAVPDNFLFSGEEIRLIDWEYAGMQDPHVDIAMFCIYSLYERAEVDNLIDLYFENNCTKETRLKIYCYIAACGLLWSNWCEYKRQLGIEFGEYSLRQYRYAKEYYRIFMEDQNEGR